MARMRIPWPEGSSSGELLSVGHKAKVKVLRRLAIMLLYVGVASLFDLGYP